MLAFTWIFSSLACSAPAAATPRPALVLQLGNPFTATVVSLAAHAPLLAAGTATGIQLWDTRTWELKRTITVSRDDPNQSPSALALALSPDGKRLADTTAEGRIEIWECASGVRRRVILHEPATHLWFTPDGKEIVDSKWGNFVKGRQQRGTTTFWNIRTGQRRLSLTVGGDFALSANGHYIAILGYSSTAKAARVALWDTRTGRSLGTLSDSSGVFAPLAFSPDGRKLVTVGEDPDWEPPSGFNTQAAYAHNLTLKIWDLKTHRRLRVMPGQSNQFTQGLQWSADGQHIVSSGRIVLVYTADGHLVHKITDLGWDSQLSADGATLLGSDNSQIVSLDLRTGLRHTHAHSFWGTAYVLTAAYSTDNTFLAADEEGAAEESNRTRLWAGNVGTALRTVPSEYASQIFFLPNGRNLVTARRQKIQIWNAETGMRQRTITNGLPENVDTALDEADLLLSPDGTTLLRKSGNALDRTAEVLEAATGQKRVLLSGMEQPLGTAIISPDGAMLSNQNGNGVAQIPPDPPCITVWSLHTGKVLYNFPTTASIPGPYAFSSDSQTLAISDWKETNEEEPSLGVHSRILLYDMAGGQLRRTIDLGSDMVRGLLFSPDNRLLAVSHDGQVQFYETTTGRSVGTLSSPQKNLLALTFSPDGTRLVTEEQNTGFSQNLMCVWRVRDGCQLATLIGLVVNGHPSPDWLAVTPDGYYAASVGARTAIRFRVGDRLLSTDRCPAMNQPDLVRKALSGK